MSLQPVYNGPTMTDPNDTATIAFAQAIRTLLVQGGDLISQREAEYLAQCSANGGFCHAHVELRSSDDCHVNVTLELSSPYSRSSEVVIDGNVYVPADLKVGVSWPSIGTVDPMDAMLFAELMSRAARIAAGAKASFGRSKRLLIMTAEQRVEQERQQLERTNRVAVETACRAAVDRATCMLGKKLRKGQRAAFGWDDDFHVPAASMQLLVPTQSTGVHTHTFRDVRYGRSDLAHTYACKMVFATDGSANIMGLQRIA